MKQGKVRQVGFLVMLALAAMAAAGMGACELFRKGDRVLFVSLVDTDSGEKLSELGVVKEALEAGGSISVDVSVARQLDEKFDERYAVADTKGSFIVLPAILNWVGGHGWRFIGPSLGGWIFAKPR